MLSLKLLFLERDNIMDYMLAHRESEDLEAMYRDLCEQTGLSSDERDLKQDILGVLNRRGWRISG